MSIKLLNGTIDIFDVAGKSTLIFRGIIDPESLCLIQVGPYQREILPGSRAKDLVEALKTSTVPDIELGMRGEKYRVHQPEEKNAKTGDTVFLQDQVFVIDGLQRISAARTLMEKDPTARPRIGTVVHINTTEEWEGERFRILNQLRTKLNVNILLRNLKQSSPFVDMMIRLCQDETFVLFSRVQWTQRMVRGEVIPAMVLCRTAGFLHSRFGPGRETSPDGLASAMNRTMDKVGRNTMRDNIKTFFEVLDECYGVKRITYHHGAVYVRSSFLLSLAELFTRHQNFWRGQRLFVEKDLRTKIAKFPINDPEVVRLASSTGKAREILYQLILDDVNCGKRTRRLEPVDGMEPKVLVGDTMLPPVSEPEMAGVGK